MCATPFRLVESSPPTRVRRGYQTPVKQRIVAEKGSNNAGSAGGGSSGLLSHGRHQADALRWGRNCGLRGQDSPEVPPRSRPRSARSMRLRAPRGRITRPRPSFYGAMMLLLKRLTMLAMTFGAILGAAVRDHPPLPHLPPAPRPPPPPSSPIHHPQQRSPQLAGPRGQARHHHS